MLEFLIRRRGEVVSKAEILDNVWDFAFDGDPNIVEVYIRHLRTKIDEPFGRHAIETVRGGRLPARPGRRLSVRRRLRSVRVRITVVAVVVVGLALARRRELLLTTYRASLTNDVETAARLRSRDIADAIKSGDARLHAREHRRRRQPRAGRRRRRYRSSPSSPNVAGEPTISHLRPGRDRIPRPRPCSHLPVGDSRSRVVARRCRRSTEATYTVYVAAEPRSARRRAPANLMRLLL